MLQRPLSIQERQDICRKGADVKKMNVEILAPAGSYESMVAAVNAGADAVYIGGSRFGARAYADNLTRRL